MSNPSNTPSTRYSGNGASPWTNDPNETSPFTRYATPPDPRVARAQRAATFESLGSGISQEARDSLRTILSALNNMEDAASGYPARFIFNSCSEDEQVMRGGVPVGVRRVPKQSATRDERDFAQVSLNAQRQIVEKATAAANAAFPLLRTRLLADSISRPSQATEAQISDRKNDLVAAISAAGKIAGNALAQKLIQQAVQEGDQLTIWTLCASGANGPLRFRAESLGLNQATLQAIYVQAQMAKTGQDAGVRPLNAQSVTSRPVDSPVVPGGALILALDGVKTLITETSQAATQALAQLARECGLN